MNDRVSRGSTPQGAGQWLHAYGPALWAAAVLLASLCFLMLSTQIRYAHRPGRLGPDFWPQAILILLIITAAVDLLVEVGKGQAQTRIVSSSGEEGGHRRVWWLMALGLVIMLAYVNLSAIIGFPLANFLFMIVFMAIGGFGRPVVTVLISAVGTTTLVLLFVRIVYVSLPIGTGPFENLTLAFYALLGIV